MDPVATARSLFVKLPLSMRNFLSFPITEVSTRIAGGLRKPPEGGNDVGKAPEGLQ